MTNPARSDWQDPSTDLENVNAAYRIEANENARLRAGLALIVREAEQFPDQDGIGAGVMARNLLEGR